MPSGKKRPKPQLTAMGRLLERYHREHEYAHALRMEDPRPSDADLQAALEATAKVKRRLAIKVSQVLAENRRLRVENTRISRMVLQELRPKNEKMENPADGEVNER